jgi:L-alanine-DL-glutamate epimerase-like enolase superfamily enzyme
VAPIRRIEVRRLRMPLVKPYRLSYRIFEEFEPFVVLVEGADGTTGFGDAHISPGSSSETREGGWAFIGSHAPRLIGLTPPEAKALALQDFSNSKGATTALVSAIEVFEGIELVDLPEATTLPLLMPVGSLAKAEIEAEVETLLAEGCRTFKVKVGRDVESDLARVAAIQRSARGRATLRLDANRAYSRNQGIAFASKLDPAGIELFEQPCESDEWEANGAVAAASPVPLMLDEPICTLEDIARAGDMPRVGFCKLKLKRFGSLERLKQGLDAVRAHGMEPVLGDGLGSEIQGWLEAAIARTTIANAGEFNGFLKPKDRLFENPIPFVDGAIRLPANYRPRLDAAALDRFTVEVMKFGT